MLRFVDQEVPSKDITRLPAGEQGPSQGPYTPVQRIPGMGWGPDGREPAPNFARPIRQAAIPDETGLYEDDLFVDKRKPPESLTGVLPL